MAFEHIERAIGIKNESSNATGIMVNGPEMRIVQSQHGTNKDLGDDPMGNNDDRTVRVSFDDFSEGF